MSGTAPEGTEQPAITTTTTTAAAAAEAEGVTNTPATTMKSPNQPTQNETQNITPGSEKNLLKDFCGEDFKRKYAFGTLVKREQIRKVWVKFLVHTNGDTDSYDESPFFLKQGIDGQVQNEVDWSLVHDFGAFFIGIECENNCLPSPWKVWVEAVQHFVNKNLTNAGYQPRSGIIRGNNELKAVFHNLAHIKVKKL